MVNKATPQSGNPEAEKKPFAVEVGKPGKKRLVGIIPSHEDQNDALFEAFLRTGGVSPDDDPGTKAFKKYELARSKLPIDAAHE